MRPIKTFVAACILASLGACTVEPDSIFEPEPEDGVVDNIADDGVVDPGETGEGDGLPPPIALPPGSEGGPTAADALVAPGRDEHIAACTSSCDGIYQRHGALPFEWCLCRTEDTGSRCESGSDCEGDCLYVGLEAVGGGMAIPYGECAEFEQVFGCYAFLPEIADGPVEAEGFSPPAICID